MKITNIPAPGKSDWFQGVRYDLDTKFPEGFEPGSMNMELDLAALWI